MRPEEFPPDAWGIIPFDGYGTAKRIWCGGRVIERAGIIAMRNDDGLLDNLRKMLRRYLSRPGTGTSVRVRLDDHQSVVTPDRDGFFHVELTRTESDHMDLLVHRIALELVRPSPGVRVRTTCKAYVPSTSARFGVISDIDDTIVHTNATDRLRMARIILFGNARTRLPFSGVRAFYRALRAGPNGSDDNPFFYVSSSSWHLYDVMRDFMKLNRLPPGALILRHMSFSRESLFGRERHGHKLERIAEILQTYPELPFVLIGDSGQRDAELYTKIVRRFPRRILCVYIRDVFPATARRAAIEALADSIREAGSELLLVDTTLEAAEHAASRELISSERLAAVAEDEIRDEPQALLPKLASEVGRALAHRTRPVTSVYRALRGRRRSSR